MSDPPDSSGSHDWPPPPWRPTWPVLRRLLASTIGTCFRYRVTGLAAEAAFFAILSLPPLVFAFAGSIGYVADALGETTVGQIRDEIVGAASRLVTEEGVVEVIEPTLDDVLAGGRADVISLGFVLALWSGSRALNVFVDTVTIMYGLGGRRGIVKTRALSFGLYVVGLLVGVVVLPLVLAGPELVQSALPVELAWLQLVYWPVVVLLSVVFLTTLYHLSVPVRTPWSSDLPGAVVALTVWIGGSYVLRWILSAATGGTSIFGPLAAPIAVLVWLYVTSIAVLIGAAVNAAWDQVWPARETARARRRPADGRGEGDGAGGEGDGAGTEGAGGGTEEAGSGAPKPAGGKSTADNPITPGLSGR